jgi:hypothetical protein
VPLPRLVEPARVAGVHDEPTGARRYEPRLRLLELGLGNHGLMVWGGQRIEPVAPRLRRVDWLLTPRECGPCRPARVRAGPLPAPALGRLPAVVDDVPAPALPTRAGVTRVIASCSRDRPSQACGSRAAGALAATSQVVHVRGADPGGGGRPPPSRGPLRRRGPARGPPTGAPTAPSGRNPHHPPDDCFQARAPLDDAGARGFGLTSSSTRYTGR